MRNRAFFAIVALLVASISYSQAALILVGTRAGLGGNDHINWANAGANFSNPSNPFNVNTNLGDSVTVSMPAAHSFQRLNQGAGWSGNFAPGDALLYTNDTGNFQNPISIFNFDGAGVSAAGAQIQANFFGAFVGRIEAFDSANNSLGFFNVNGNSTSAADNSAIFLGVRSTTTMISRIAFSVDSGVNGDASFAINRVDLDNRATPEPMSLAIFGGLAVAGIAGYRRRQAKA